MGQGNRKQWSSIGLHNAKCRRLSANFVYPSYIHAGLVQKRSHGLEQLLSVFSLTRRIRYQPIYRDTTKKPDRSYGVTLRCELQ